MRYEKTKKSKQIVVLFNEELGLEENIAKINNRLSCDTHLTIQSITALNAFNNALVVVFNVDNNLLTEEVK